MAKKKQRERNNNEKVCKQCKKKSHVTRFVCRLSVYSAGVFQWKGSSELTFSDVWKTKVYSHACHIYICHRDDTSHRYHSHMTYIERCVSFEIVGPDQLFHHLCVILFRRSTWIPYAHNSFALRFCIGVWRQIVSKSAVFVAKAILTDYNPRFKWYDSCYRLKWISKSFV